jgi:sterol desaturase/sphingolipid hydroxylase (fatty acid hydroxylase superfamily)/CDGSH-type Zn-finger protein
MDNIIHYLGNNPVPFVIGVLVFFGLIEVVFGYLSNSKRTKDDIMVEVVNTFLIMVIYKPVVTFLIINLMIFLFPNGKDIMSSLPIWANFIIFLLAEDFGNFMFHKTAHENKWFWKWHRPHHAATEMGLLVSYRGAAWYYALIPNVWLIGVFTYLGAGLGLGLALIFHQLFIISSHSMATWDAPFYRNKYLLPFIKVFERIFVTPAFHHGHHGVSIIDDIGNPNGNYGAVLSIWDQMFGTAHFAHDFPTEYGLPNDPKDSWQSHLFYPFIKSDKAGSELAADFKFEKTTVNEPAILTLKEGDYLYCQCGYSKNQPFCDGSHHGTKSQPMKFTIKKEREYKLCQCKGCAKGPFCDDSHLKMT